MASKIAGPPFTFWRRLAPPRGCTTLKPYAAACWTREIRASCPKTGRATSRFFHSQIGCITYEIRCCTPSRRRALVRHPTIYQFAAAMLRLFLRRKLDAEEKKLGESMDYLRHIVDISPTSFLRFACVMPFANSRKTLPKEVWCVAQVVTLQHEDCGPCLQITLNPARQEGVSAELSLHTTASGNQPKSSTEVREKPRRR